MDVRLLNSRVVFFFLIFAQVFLVACGDRFNIQSERGRRARIDEANFQLSAGNCQAAVDAIGPLYSSNFIDDEIRIVQASAYACFANFSVLRLLSNLAGSTNYFSALAKTMPNSLGDGRLANMYSAVDALTNSNVSLNGTIRGKELNTYMVFLQLGLMGLILDAYGNATVEGAQTTDLAYSNPQGVGEMQNADACALSAAMSSIVDSYSNSNLNDSDSAGAKNALESACVSAGLASCTVINRDRTSCTGAGGDAPSVNASAIVGSVNVAW